MRWGLAVVCAAGLCACSPPATEKIEAPAAQTAEASSVPAAPAPTDDVLTAEGYGQLHIGMTLDAARSVTGQPLNETPVDEDSAACQEQLYTTADGDTLYLMFQDYRLTRITAFEQAPRTRTREGIGLGSADAEVRAAYPNAEERPAFYVPPPSHDLIVWDRPQTSGYRFELGDTGRVHTIHAGGRSILYVEGCS